MEKRRWNRKKEKEEERESVCKMRREQREIN